MDGRLWLARFGVLQVKTGMFLLKGHNSTRLICDGDLFSIDVTVLSFLSFAARHSGFPKFLRMSTHDSCDRNILGVA